MQAAVFPRRRVLFVASLSVVYWALLGWQHTHGGVPAHSFMARDDMPKMSNWWGALTIPLLAVVLTGLLQRRLEKLRADPVAADRALRHATFAFVGALLYALAMAVSFSIDRESPIIATLFFALPAVAVLLPIFRPEYLLGFVLGLTYVLGPVIPLVVATAAACISAVAVLLLRPLVRRVFRAGQR